MKICVSLLLFFILFSSCNSEENPLCHCIKKADELNKLSNSILSLEVVSEEKQNELILLRQQIDSLCEPFKLMGPEELYEMRNQCIDEELRSLEK